MQKNVFIGSIKVDVPADWRLDYPVVKAEGIESTGFTWLPEQGASLSVGVMLLGPAPDDIEELRLGDVSTLTVLGKTLGVVTDVPLNGKNKSSASYWFLHGEDVYLLTISSQEQWDIEADKHHPYRAQVQALLECFATVSRR